MGRPPRAGLTSLILLGATLAIVALWTSPVFDVRQVRVEGNRRLSAAAVVRLAGIDADTNLLTVSAAAVERSVGRHPWIRTVVVRRTLPATLVLEVEERTAVAAVILPEGVALVAEDGTVLDIRRRARPGAVEIGRSKTSLRPGDRLRGLREELSVARSLPPGVRRRVASAEATARGELRLRLHDGARVLYGAPTAIPEKNAALARLLRWAGEQGVVLSRVDLRAPGSPAVIVAQA